MSPGFYKSRNEPFLCKGCGQAITWIKMTPSGKAMPVNPSIVSIVTPDGQIVRGYVAHWTTCPKASDFKCAGS